MEVGSEGSPKRPRDCPPREATSIIAPFDDGLVGAEDEDLGPSFRKGAGDGWGYAVALSGQEGDFAIQSVLRVDGHGYLLESSSRGMDGAYPVGANPPARPPLSMVMCSPFM